MYSSKNGLKAVVIIFLLLLSKTSLHSQCTIVSTCGYSVTVNVKALSIVPSTTNCTSAPGYNYNVKFTYTITVVGTNTCSNGTLGVQPQIYCNSGQSNGYFTISNAVPNGAASATHSGTLTTTTNPWRGVADCNSSTPTSLGCNSMSITIFGPGISSSTYPCSFSTMPIELYEFSGAYDNGSVSLKWSTASELNNNYFTLERSTNGMDWDVIKTVKGAGTSLSPKHYETSDNAYNQGLNYYRLKQTDFDGTYKYSGIVPVDALNGKGGNINLYPNPTNDIVNIESDSETPKTVQLLNAQGKVLHENNVGLKGSFSIAELPAGVYFLRAFEGDNVSHYKIIKK